MRFEEWEPVYRAILADFGYSREADEHARDVLGDLVNSLDSAGASGPAGPSDQSYFDFVGQTVAVAGAGPSLRGEVELTREADVVVAASGAADVLRKQGIGVDCMVTDLDKNPDTARRLTLEGVPVAVHAHGDNVAALREWVPRMAAAHVLPTTQAAPAGPVRNVGGFTDGDRAAFLADHAGADSFVFVGWDFDDPTVSETKAHKLAWAERLLRWLEHRRGERFDVLDGRRENIDERGLPSDV